MIVLRNLRTWFQLHALIRRSRAVTPIMVDSTLAKCFDRLLFPRKQIFYQREKRFQCKRQTFYIDSGKKRAIAPWGANDAREMNARKQPITIYSKIDMETMDKGSPRRSIEL